MHNMLVEFRLLLETSKLHGLMERFDLRVDSVQKVPQQNGEDKKGAADSKVSLPSRPGDRKKGQSRWQS